MTEVRSKRRPFYPVIFTSICFKKPLLISIFISFSIIFLGKMGGPWTRSIIFRWTRSMDRPGPRRGSMFCTFPFLTAVQSSLEHDRMVAHRDKTLPRIQNTSQNPKKLSRIKKHFPELKTLHALQHLPGSKTLSRVQNTSQNAKTLSRIQNTFHTTKHFQEHWLHKLKIRGVKESLCI